LILVVAGIYLRQNRDWLKEIYAPTKIHVKISGKVRNSGIYEMTHGDQVRHLIEKAGGLTSTIDSSNIILDTELLDGQVIRIE
jgi:protein involved in polysaccharide export with SLBB domain